MVGSLCRLLVSFSFREQEQVSWRSVFCSVFPRFLKKNKTDRSLRFPGVFKKLLAQRRNSHLFVIPPVLQGNGLIPRCRLLVFARQREKKMGSFSAKAKKKRFLRSPRGAWAPFRAIFFAFWTQKPAVFNGVRSNYFSRYHREFRCFRLCFSSTGT